MTFQLAGLDKAVGAILWTSALDRDMVYRKNRLFNMIRLLLMRLNNYFALQLNTQELRQKRLTAMPCTV
jgi:hypothetical protein